MKPEEEMAAPKDVREEEEDEEEEWMSKFIEVLILQDAWDKQKEVLRSFSVDEGMHEGITDHVMWDLRRKYKLYYNQKDKSNEEVEAALEKTIRERFVVEPVNWLRPFHWCK
ncbi:hypothetical protein HDV00_003177 [Rhizophlyctis rosea]|nr:hypothetical protein HDV00_003177 [Rhizophlyctis rosea]